MIHSAKSLVGPSTGTAWKGQKSPYSRNSSILNDMFLVIMLNNDLNIFENIFLGKV